MKKDRVTYHDAIAFFRSIGKDDVANLLFIFRNKKVLKWNYFNGRPIYVL